jgi:hypothetical protein
MKKRMRVNYHVPGQEFEKPLFKYLLSTDGTVLNGKMAVEITSLDPAGHPHAINEKRSIVTDNAEIALTGALAILNSHHDKLKAITGPIEDDK